MEAFTWEVKPDGGVWKVYRERVRVFHRPDRESCVEYARREAATEIDVFEHNVRLLISNEDGSVEEELLSANQAPS